MFNFQIKKDSMHSNVRQSLLKWMKNDSASLFTLYMQKFQKIKNFRLICDRNKNWKNWFSLQTKQKLGKFALFLLKFQKRFKTSLNFLYIIRRAINRNLLDTKILFIYAACYKYNSLCLAILELLSDKKQNR